MREVDRIVSSKYDDGRRLLRPANPSSVSGKRHDSRQASRASTSSKQRLENLLKAPLPRNNLDAYISIEQNSEAHHGRAAAVPAYPDYHKHELQRLRLQSEQPRIMSSNRHYHDKLLARDRQESSVQPRLHTPPKQDHRAQANRHHNHSYEDKGRLL